MLEREFVYEVAKSPRLRFSLKHWVNFWKNRGLTSLLPNEEVERLEELAQKPTGGWTIPPRERIRIAKDY